MLVQQGAVLEEPATSGRRRAAVRGPAAVRASLVAAAGELFAARGTASVSVREIADRAGVNHGLIHHYFGSKQGLVDATLDELAVQAAKSFEAGLDLSPEAPLPRYLLAASRALLDGDVAPEQVLQPGALSDIVRRLAELRADGASAGVARSHAHGSTGVSPSAPASDDGSSSGHAERAELAEAMRSTAMLIGWLLVEPVLVQAAGLDGEAPERVRSEVLEAALR